MWNNQKQQKIGGSISCFFHIFKCWRTGTDAICSVFFLLFQFLNTFYTNPFAGIKDIFVRYWMKNLLLYPSLYCVWTCGLIIIRSGSMYMWEQYYQVCSRQPVSCVPTRFNIKLCVLRRFYLRETFKFSNYWNIYWNCSLLTLYSLNK